MGQKDISKSINIELYKYSWKQIKLFLVIDNAASEKNKEYLSNTINHSPS